MRQVILYPGEHGYWGLRQPRGEQDQSRAQHTRSHRRLCCRVAGGWPPYPGGPF
jgi:hypothetical protein